VFTNLKSQKHDSGAMFDLIAATLCNFNIKRHHSDSLHITRRLLRTAKYNTPVLYTYTTVIVRPYLKVWSD